MSFPCAVGHMSEPGEKLVRKVVEVRKVKYCHYMNWDYRRKQYRRWSEEMGREMVKEAFFCPEHIDLAPAEPKIVGDIKLVEQFEPHD